MLNHFVPHFLCGLLKFVIRNFCCVSLIKIVAVLFNAIFWFVCIVHCSLFANEVHTNHSIAVHLIIHYPNICVDCMDTLRICCMWMWISLSQTTKSKTNNSKKLFENYFHWMVRVFIGCEDFWKKLRNPLWTIIYWISVQFCCNWTKIRKVFEWKLPSLQWINSHIHIV